jgi:hypothetical protein
MNGTATQTRVSGLVIAAWLMLAAPAGVRAGDAAAHLGGWLGAGVTDIDYAEFDQGVSLDGEQGIVPVLAAHLQLARGRLFAETTLVAGSGRVDYASASAVSDTDEDIIDWDAIAGREFLGREGNRVGLYGGLGYRHWQRDIHSTPGVDNGLYETYRWWYGILGVRGEHDVNRVVKLRADLQLTRLLDPSIKVRFAAGYDDHSLDLGTASGLRAALTLEHRLGNGMTVFVSPWFEYWQPGRSADAALTQNGMPAGTLFEPRSETRSLGILAGAGWRLF